MKLTDYSYLMSTHIKPSFYFHHIVYLIDWLINLLLNFNPQKMVAFKIK